MIIDYTVEKLKAALKIAKISPQGQAFVLANWERLLPQIKTYVAAIMADWPAFPKIWESLNLPTGLDEGERSVFMVAAYCFMMDASRQRYLERGYTKEMWLEAMPDISWHAHDKEDSTLWLDTCNNEFNWHFSILNAHNITLGRLQFYQRTCPFDFPEYGVAKDDNVAGFHIPANGPLDIEACKASFRRAQDFFAKYHPDWVFKGFFCQSWFLNPIYKNYLPPTANILRFQDLGKAINYPNNSKDAIRRVFAFRGVSIDNPNPPTKMQRAIQAIIKDGNSIANGAIFIPKQ